uniref:Hexosyltransferase n=1 Tax=Lactuca sativa TaxID=4236 RepID=A0A9R1VQ60_LACSA|nr:hypothetical protein LSAT_V11C400170800 [Lactuca sativa]
MKKHDDGKTYTYFSSLPNILSHPYDYVMKADDDDAYFRLLPLASSLQPLPRSDLYYGFVIPSQSMDPFVSYMSGMGFVLSWDLVEWICNAPFMFSRGTRRFSSPTCRVEAGF